MICIFFARSGVIFCMNRDWDAQKARIIAPFTQSDAALPDFFSDIDHQPELGPLLLFGQAVALFC